MSRKIAFVTYETPFAPCGGIAAVMGQLPSRTQTASGVETIVITPYHHKIAKTASLETEHVGETEVPFYDRTVKVTVRRYVSAIGWYFLDAEDRQFFGGERHPYDVGITSGDIGANLARDALFFGASVARAIEVIDQDSTWILAMQDWEAATAALALAGGGGGHRLFLTLHNSYDSGAVSDDTLRIFGIDPATCPGPAGRREASVLERGLAVVQWPVFTVSDQFALDLTQDLFQASVIAPHLRAMLEPRLCGVDNGPFVELALDTSIVAKAMRGTFTQLRAWKRKKKTEALQALSRLESSEQTPVWGKVPRLRSDDSVWFVMAGRDDARQKGYDVAVLAATEFLDRGGDARFLFFPIPGDEGLAGLSFLKNLTERFPEQVLALPFLWREGFFSALQGAEFGIMPSLYEPFGMANEFYLNGTVGIGRATGGILEQIVPLRAVSSCSRAVQSRARAWHSVSAAPTGLLFREKDGMVSAWSDWSAINRTEYDRSGGFPDRLEARRNYPLFRSMAEELRFSLADGVQLSRNDPDLYFRMLVDGIAHIQRTFSWDRAAAEYLRNLL
ncbi:MAG: glycogen/starch synthase [Desulfomonile tiedjei]|nr:glycogen/starch synthase [Desulfomonile tiedjei]